MDDVSSAKLVIICFISLLTLSFLSPLQVNARDSQFFSKVTSSNNNVEEPSLSKLQKEPTTTTSVPGSQKLTTTTSVPDSQKLTTTTSVPDSQKLTTTTTTATTTETPTFNRPRQPEPSFIPETQNAGYGLYGQEDEDQFPTTTTSADGDVKYEPYTTPITSTPTGTFEYNAPTTTTSAMKYEPYTTPITSTATGTFEPYTTSSNTPTTTSYSNKKPNNNNYYYYNNNNNNNNGFDTQQESLGDSKFQESNGFPTGNQNRNNYNYNNNNNNLGKQGMSDTRFMENGKYYYDVNNERNYYPNQHQQQQNYYNDNSKYENGYNNNNSVENEEKYEFDELP